MGSSEKNERKEKGQEKERKKRKVCADEDNIRDLFDRCSWKKTTVITNRRIYKEGREGKREIHTSRSFELQYPGEECGECPPYTYS